MLTLSNYLDSNFELEPFESTKRWTEWKSLCFGLEFTMTYFVNKNEYYFSACRSEKIAHLIPLENQIEFTDISQEMLDLLQVILPEDKLYL